MRGGKLIISLDFELLWGVRDVVGIQQYGKHIKGVHTVIPKLLEVFTEYKIKGTFAIVGFLFFENKTELLGNLPLKVPMYIDKSLSPYTGYFNNIGESFKDDPYHYAPQLIRLIQSYPDQEIGSHTFSHYYCLEAGQTIDDFKNDLESANNMADKFNINLTSLIFPRNQFNKKYLKVCEELGITNYRGNESSNIYKAINGLNGNLIKRGLRLLDAYINLTGHNCYTNEFLKSQFPVNIPSSRFLRPYSKKLKWLDVLRLHRIKTGMSYAAKKNLTYHLWWHPHNFGINQKENFAFLKQILEHYKYLNAKYEFQSYAMTELANSLFYN